MTFAGWFTGVIFASKQARGCHNVDQGKPVPAVVLPMKKVFPRDDPVVLAKRESPLNPIMDTPGVFFDDKMAVINASLRGEKRGIALPLLLDLARKQAFLQDNTVTSLENLFDSSRGTMAPHPFYLSDSSDRAAVIEFLRGLDPGPTVR